MYSFLFLAVISFLLSSILTPLVRNLFLRIGIVDRPDNNRKLHKVPVVRVGGVAVALSYALAFGLFTLGRFKGGLIVRDALPLVLKLFPAAACIFVTGLLDDLINLKPWQKLSGQLLGATVAYFAGIQIVALDGRHFANWWSFPLTLMWLLACTNALNLIDGVDGLAAGIGLFATTTMILGAVVQHNVELGLATVPLAACLLAFLRYNFNPATVFLGDSGSLFIGFLLGCYGVLWTQKSVTLLGMTAPILALSIPLIDVFLAVVRRFLRRQPIFGADRGHIHHRLLDRGLSPRRVALLLYAICLLAGLFSLSILNHQYEFPLLMAFCVGVCIGIRQLRFVEFDTLGRLIREGSFRRLLNLQISLQNLEANLSLAKTPDDCWAVLKSSYKEFGFSEIELCLVGRIYREDASLSIPRSCRIDIPLSASDYVHLTRALDSGAKRNEMTPFVDILCRVLEPKIPLFAATKLLPALALPETSSNLWRSASTAS